MGPIHLAAIFVPVPPTQPEFGTKMDGACRQGVDAFLPSQWEEEETLKRLSPLMLSAQQCAVVMDSTFPPQ